MNQAKVTHGLRFLAGTALLLTTFSSGICQATSITISGRVIDTDGAAIVGASVAFRSSGTGVLTDTDGSFLLEKSSAAISAPDYHATIPKYGSIAIQGGKIRVNTTKSASVLSVKAFGINGRLLFQKQHPIVSGENTVPLPVRGNNLHICRITFGNHYITVKHVPSINLTKVLESSSLYHCGQSPRAATMQISPDIIDVVKDGMLDYHTTVSGRDTSGVIITMLPSAGTVTDADGNIYQSVRIGNQVWTTENLRTTKYNDGSPIPCITDNMQWAQCTTGAYCSYENSASNASTFGQLYNWYVVASGKLAPQGWKIPSAHDFDTLKAAITAQMVGYTVLNSSKIAGRTHWTPSTGVSVPGNITDSTNSTGFSALPGGIRDLDGSFYFLDTNANFWTVTPDTVQQIGAHARRLIYSYNHIWEGVFYKRCGCSVRLIKEQ